MSLPQPEWYTVFNSSQQVVMELPYEWAAIYYSTYYGGFYTVHEVRNDVTGSSLVNAELLKTALFNEDKPGYEAAMKRYGEMNAQRRATSAS